MKQRFRHGHVDTINVNNTGHKYIYIYLIKLSKNITYGISKLRIKIYIHI